MVSLKFKYMRKKRSQKSDEYHDVQLVEQKAIATQGEQEYHSYDRPFGLWERKVKIEI